MYFSPALIALVASLSFANGHMIMNSPHPYGADSLNSSPLAADGSDFPCKNRGASTWTPPTESNSFAIGQQNTLSFTGSAVHGGGSCQVSLTTDAQPDKNSKWQVIHSIIGGCPANVDGNLPDDSSGHGASTFQWSVPQGINPGNYTLAWTWFNRIGNREMYMNCAPISVTGGSSKRDEIPAEYEAPVSKRQTTFPELFVANIGNGCGTVNGGSLQFPDPGPSVQTISGYSIITSLSGTCAAVAAATGSPSGGSSAAAPVSSATATAPASASSAAASPGTFASGAAAAAGSTPSASAAPVASAPVPVASAAGSTASVPIPSGSSSTTPTMSGACTSEGDWICLGGSSYQRCASGQWSAPQPMAAGTLCNPGQSTTLQMNAVKYRRHIRPRHVRKSMDGWGN